MTNTEKNQNTPREENFICRHCGNKTSHLLLYSHTIPVSLGINQYDFTELTSNNYFFLFQCKTCTGISLKNVFEEEIDSSGDFSFDDIRYLYPSSKTFNQEVPTGLRLVIKEANKVKLISSMAYLVLIRKVLEELCRDKKIKEKNLQENLKKLVEVEHLPIVFAEASDKLRLLGNIGAHESKIEINKEEIELVEEFMFALIEYIYVIPSKLNQLNEALKLQKDNKPI